MKKLISVILAVIMLFSVCSAAVYGQESEKSDLPVIIVAGYGASPLFKAEDDGTETQLWPLDFSGILDIVLNRIIDLGVGIGALTLGNAKYIADVIGSELPNVVKDLQCNPDGSSKYNVYNKYDSADECSTEAALARDPESIFVFEKDFQNEFLKYTTADNIYSFSCDFRMGSIACAEKLDQLIQQVKERSGKDKVNIVSLSHGGQTTGTYLSLFGDKCDVDNAVMQVPAFCGASLVEDLLSRDAHLDELNLIQFIEHAERIESDYHWLVEAQKLGFIDDIIYYFIPYVIDLAGNWGSIWDFCPPENYEKYKTQYLDPVKNAEIIEKTDRMHYEIMPNFGEVFNRCQDEYGMNLTIVSGTDNGCTSGWRRNGDGIITTACSTGAICADFGKRFADGYTQIDPCGGKNKVSPAMTIDASTAFLPDDTWFIDGMFHGMMYWDTFTRDLVVTALFTDEIENVYSSPEYPQFHASTNPSYAVWAAFDKSAEGFLSSEDSSLTLKNLSWEDKDLRILAVTCDGADLRFDLSGTGIIKAGESISIPFSGTVPAESMKKITLTVSYGTKGSVTPLGERELSFTVMNGAPSEFNSSEPIVSAEPGTALSRILPPFIINFLKNAGLYRLFSMLLNIFNGIISRIF